MTYKEAIEFITSANYLGSKLGLERLKVLLDRMGNPEKKLEFIHIAGTNGKGSTASMIASILKESGKRVGLFTSPFLVDYTEQLMINGVPIEEEAFAKVTAFVATAAQTMSELPTEFERVTAIAFQYFYEKQCDIVVLEVGLGGRLDATNVIDTAKVAVITSISLDHTEFLGSTLEEIAKEKAGIIKKNGIVVSYEQPFEVDAVLEATCKEENARLNYANFSFLSSVKTWKNGQSFCYKEFHEIELKMLGEHQRNNACVALEVMKVLNESGYEISQNHIKAGLKKVCWPARFEVLSEEPTVILDGGHNVAGIKAATSILREQYKDKKAIIVTGVMADKQYSIMFDLLAPFAKEFIAVKPKNSRALAVDLLVEELKKHTNGVYEARTIPHGIELALSHANKEDLILVIGSLYMAGEVRSIFSRGAIRDF